MGSVLYNIITMNKISTIFLALAMLVCVSAKAQFKQDFHKVEYMLKVEAGYLPFMTNIGHAGDNGYYNEDLRHAAGLNVINGVCISQDFFLGFGVGYNYVARPNDIAGGWHSGLAFADFDYRPIDDEWAPMLMARLGASYMMADNSYGNTLTSYAEVGIGFNWYFNYVYRNMERNYKSVYVTLGLAYMQQATFLPIRVGVRF